MNNAFDFDTVEARAEDALNLVEAVAELLEPLTDTPSPDPSDLYDLVRRARMIDTTLRAARDYLQDALAALHAADSVPAPIFPSV